MTKRIQTIASFSCDLCGNDCADTDNTIEIQVNEGDGRDVGPAFLRGRITAYIPYGADRGDVCRPCLLKWLSVWVRNQAMS